MKWSREKSKLPWPLDVRVQGSEGGLVVSKEGNYRTAFVEVFPPEGFIRGEGLTLQEAESGAWAQYITQTSCEETTGHEFERRHYTNGAGLCKHCEAFRVDVFSELPPDPNREPTLIEQLIDQMVAETEKPA